MTRSIGFQKDELRKLIRGLVRDILESRPGLAEILVWLFLGPVLQEMTLTQLTALFGLMRAMAEGEHHAPPKGDTPNETPEP